jgi:uncharacterized membrane protein
MVDVGPVGKFQASFKSAVAVAIAALIAFVVETQMTQVSSCSVAPFTCLTSAAVRADDSGIPAIVLFIVSIEYTSREIVTDIE